MLIQSTHKALMSRYSFSKYKLSTLVGSSLQRRGTLSSPSWKQCHYPSETVCHYCSSPSLRPTAADCDHWPLENKAVSAKNSSLAQFSAHWLGQNSSSQLWNQIELAMSGMLSLLSRNLCTRKWPIAHDKWSQQWLLLPFQYCWNQSALSASQQDSLCVFLWKYGTTLAKLKNW